VVQIAVAAIVFYEIAKTLRSDWREYQHVPLVVRPDWRYVLLSGAIVLVTYALLVEVWRRILAAWQASISFGDAVRIWCVSNLGKYVPGKVWQILAMGKMAEAVSVPPAAAAGSAILSTVVNIGVGFAVAVIAGWRAMNTLSGGYASLGATLVVVIIGGALLLPYLLPMIVRAGERLTRRRFNLERLPARAVYIAIVGNVIAWLLYGWSFQLLVRGVLGSAPGRFTDYVAAYALSYVIGYLVIVIPGGLGVREGVQTAALSTMKLATFQQAGVVAVTSRLWITVLEILPGLVYLALSAQRRARGIPSRDGSKI
jgi:uncharacterized membrane protein YbhN (UPF0104 family)